VENVLYNVLPAMINSNWQWDLVYSSQVQVFSLEDSFEPHRSNRKASNDVNELGQYLNPNATVGENECFKLQPSNETVCCTPYSNIVTAQIVIQSSVDDSSNVRDVLIAQREILTALASALNDSFGECTTKCCPSIQGANYELIRLVGE
jgi:hypothetical protein